MTINHVSKGPTDDIETDIPGEGARDAIGRLFAAALDGDRHAEAALHLLGGFDEKAHRASWALLRDGLVPAQPAHPDVLASIERTLAALSDLKRPL